MHITSEQISQILDLYNQGRYLHAYRMAVAIAPLAAWEGTSALILAGRLANNLGSAALGRKLHLRAYRGNPQDGEAAYYKARILLERKGPLVAWQFMRQTGEQIQGTTRVQADWLAFHASVLGALRDFDAAEEWSLDLDRALPLARIGR